MEKGGQKGIHRVPSGIVGMVFEVGMKWEWVEGAWGAYQHEVCSLDYSIQFVLPFSLFLTFKWQHGSDQYLFLLLQLVIDSEGAIVSYAELSCLQQWYHQQRPNDLWPIWTRSMLR